MISTRLAAGERAFCIKPYFQTQTSLKQWQFNLRGIHKRTLLRPVSLFGGNNKEEATNGKNKVSNPFSNFSELLKTAQAAQARASVEAQKAQEELSKYMKPSMTLNQCCYCRQEFDGYDEEETVKVGSMVLFEMINLLRFEVVMSGNQEPKGIELTEAVAELELEEMQKRITEAMKDAHTKSVTAMKDRMKQLYSDLGFPMPPQIQD
eukprot:g2902.t1